jgi:hypothetical protein
MFELFGGRLLDGFEKTEFSRTSLEPKRSTICRTASSAYSSFVTSSVAAGGSDDLD